ncbi:phage tail protein [Mammaliicoccus lentus]|uniref:Phage tail protein n=2 Tax=Mammaliicoccus lentus TaxID=42858 RepID=A0ABS6GUD0_MAMLE|nr:phage tail protein [Mammaliicoccus lentus]
MNSLVLMNRKKTFAEILTNFDFDSFKYEYEQNNERSITFTIYKTNMNSDIFDSIVNEMLILWKGQQYVIKNPAIKHNGLRVTKDVIAKHIFMEFQDHYIEKDLENEELNSDTTEEDIPTYTLKQYLDFGFKDNALGFNYIIKGNIDKRVPIDELGGKNGMEYLVEGAELFDYIYFADNKTIYIYDKATFYELADFPIIYKYNNSEISATTDTLNLKTYIKGYGKKKTKTETKNYNPIKPPNLNYNGKFFKEGTWRTQEVGASYEKRFECKWGNETLTWSLKKLSRGGLLDVYLDDKLIGRYSCYSHTARSENIVIAKNLSKGYHTFKAVHRGADPNVKEYKTAPTMYVGTEKSTTLNLTAVLKGSDVYYTSAEYKSPNYNLFGHKAAPTVYDDNALDKADLLETMKEELQDEPIVEVSTNYIGLDRVKENSEIRFIHKPIGFNLILKVVKLVESYPYLNKPVEVEFSNARDDIIKIQQRINNEIKRMKNAKGGESANGSSLLIPESYSDVVGVTLLNE